MGDPKQVHLNTKAEQLNTYDAIVVGSGISGGWAAKELCEKGLKTLVLERGRNVEHIKDYTTAFMSPWDFPHHLDITEKDKEENPVQCGAYNEGNKHFFVSDKEHPYIQRTSLPLDPRVPGRRQIPDLGQAVLSPERPGFRG